ncbi:MAG: hypothetical protein AAFR23_10775, partial [Pseudomonadota bacterium]
MIAHVASSDEKRGRVLLAVGTTYRADAIDASVRLAHAYTSSVEILFVEDPHAFACGRLDFLTATSVGGGALKRLDDRSVAMAYSGLRQGCLAKAIAIAQARDVPVRHRIARDTMHDAVAGACAADGPWNVVAVSDALSRESFAEIEAMLATSKELTGVLVSGSKAGHHAETVIAVVDRSAYLTSVLRTANRIAEANRWRVTLMIAGESEAATVELEDAVR